MLVLEDCDCADIGERQGQRPDKASDTVRYIKSTKMEDICSVDSLLGDTDRIL